MQAMNSSRKHIVIIPAFEPDDKLIVLLQQIKAETDYSAIVVDDGSTKKASEFIEKAALYATVLHHQTNIGKGAAIKTALEHIKNNFPANAVIVTMDADGQHKLSDAVRVCDAAAKHESSLIIGSRKFAGQVPLRSRFGNAITRFVYKIVTGIKVKDTQTGLRAFGAEMIPFMLDVDGKRYEYEMNVLLDCARQKVPIHEVMIETVYINDNASSHFDTIKDSYRIYKEILRFCASSLICFVTDFLIFSLMILLTRDLLVSVSVPLSNIVARVISASLNFYINKKYVFKSKESYAKSAIKYFALAGGILLANTFILTVLVKHVIGNEFISKIIVEVSLFIVSWLVQRFLIFKKRAGMEESAT